MLLIARPAPGEFLPYYGRYIDLVGDDLFGAMRSGVDSTRGLLGGLPEARGDFRYAPDKWSVKEVLGHVIDCERVFTYRALRFSRNDATPLPGFDENAWTPQSGYASRTLPSLLDEHRAVRAATVAFFENLPEAMWGRTGTANDARMSVRAAAYVIAGHELHHQNVLRERYLKS
ncbi:MAG TPA: DinB family protein [Candidatus Eisenbacteria bacterium]|jgi:hypothetical protein|nr:DinB family protein [Candidatus Eisenbacteria bacterium]